MCTSLPSPLASGEKTKKVGRGRGGRVAARRGKGKDAQRQHVPTSRSGQSSDGGEGALGDLGRALHDSSRQLIRDRRTKEDALADEEGQVNRAKAASLQDFDIAQKKAAARLAKEEADKAAALMEAKQEAKRAQKLDKRRRCERRRPGRERHGNLVKPGEKRTHEGQGSGSNTILARRSRMLKTPLMH